MTSPLRSLMVMDRAEREHWASWEIYMRSFLTGSSQARELIATPSAMALLSQPFVDYLNKIAADLPDRPTRIG